MVRAPPCVPGAILSCGATRGQQLRAADVNSTRGRDAEATRRYDPSLKTGCRSSAVQVCTRCKPHGGIWVGPCSRPRKVENQDGLWALGSGQPKRLLAAERLPVASRSFSSSTLPVPSLAFPSCAPSDACWQRRRSAARDGAAAVGILRRRGAVGRRSRWAAAAALRARDVRA
eukprot:356181-Chlamydomonas_euryale.AAC.1